jgi:hypothetical protein
MVLAAHNKEYLTVVPTDSKDVLDRLINATQIMESKGIEVVCAKCSKRLFKNIAIRFAPQLGHVEQNQLLIGGQRPEGNELKGGVLLEPVKDMIYNPKKPFTLIVSRNGQEGTVTPEYE